MLTKGLKKETIDEHMRFTGGQVEQKKLKTALSIHVVSRSKMMRAMRPNLLKHEKGRFVAKGLSSWWRSTF